MNFGKNRVSLKAEFENPETLGLQLVRTLVEQIDGEIELRTNGGTEFRIEFGSKETGEKVT